MIINSIETVLVILILMATGFFVSWKGWYFEIHKDLMSKLILNISIPGVIITHFFTSFPEGILFSSKNMLLLPLLIMLISLGLGALLSLVLKIDKSRRGSFISMCTVSNSMFMGLPVSLGLFGEVSVPYVMFYYIINTVVFWALCSPIIRRDGQEKGEGTSVLETIKRIFTVPLITIIVAMVLIFLNYTPPNLILTTSKYLGDMSTPLSLIFVGGIIYEIGLENIKLDKSIVGIMIMRFIIAPLSAFIICKLAGIGDMPTQVFTMLTAMPVMIQIVVVAESYKADSEYIAKAVSITTLASLVFIPIYMILMSRFL